MLAAWNTHPTWLINSFIYLSAAVIAVPLSKAAGLGSIIGYLAAGIAIGPWGLGLVTNVEDILHFAEFGVVLMLFLVGLETGAQAPVEPAPPHIRLGQRAGRGMRPDAGTRQVWPQASDGASAWWAGLGLALSSTAIALQVMGERNLLSTTSGQASFSILLFQDVAAIPILALLPLLGVVSGSNEPESLMDSAQAAITIIAVIAGIVLVAGCWCARCCDG